MNNNVIDDLRTLEAHITSNEKMSVRTRWMWARTVYEQLSDKGRAGRKQQEDHVLLKAVQDALHISKSEIGHRLKLYTRYPVEEEMAAAVLQWPSWGLMVRQGLYEKSDRAGKQLETISALTLEDITERLNVFIAENPAVVSSGKFSWPEVISAVYGDTRRLVWSAEWSKFFLAPA